MSFVNRHSTSQMQQLLEEGKQYLMLQKHYLGLQSAEMLTKLLSGIVVWAMIILGGSFALLFASFALAYWVGQISGSLIIGFGVMALVLILLILLIYVNRKAWIMAGVARFVVNLTAPPTKDETYALSAELTTAERVKVGTELAERRMLIKQSAQTLFEPTAKAANKWESASNLIHNGMVILKGIRMGVSAIAAVRTMLGGKKKWRR